MITAKLVVDDPAFQLQLYVGARPEHITTLHHKADGLCKKPCGSTSDLTIMLGDLTLSDAIE